MGALRSYIPKDLLHTVDFILELFIFSRVTTLQIYKFFVDEQTMAKILNLRITFHHLVNN